MRGFVLANVAAATLSLATWPALSQSLSGPNPNLGSQSLAAAAQAAKRQCMNACRARYRDCRRLNQLPSSECLGIYQDCNRYTCTGLGPG